MSDTQRKGSAAPMWWGILIALAVTAAAVMDYSRTNETPRDSVLAHTPGAQR